MEMGNQVDVGQAQAFQPAAVVRVNGFFGKFGMGIHVSRAVHRAGAATHHHARKVIEEGAQAQFMEKPVLRRGMPAA